MGLTCPAYGGTGPSWPRERRTRTYAVARASPTSSVRRGVRLDMHTALDREGKVVFASLSGYRPMSVRNGERGPPDCAVVIVGWRGVQLVSARPFALGMICASNHVLDVFTQPLLPLVRGEAAGERRERRGEKRKYVELPGKVYRRGALREVRVEQRAGLASSNSCVVLALGLKHVPFTKRGG